MKTRVSARLVKPNPAESCREAAARRWHREPCCLKFMCSFFLNMTFYDFSTELKMLLMFLSEWKFAVRHVQLLLGSVGLSFMIVCQMTRTELSLRDNPWSCEATLESERAVFSCHCFHPGGREHDSEVSTCGTSRRAHTWKVVLVIFFFTSGPLCWRPKSLRPASRSGPGSCRWGAAPPSWSGPPGGGCPGWRTSKCPSGSFVFTRNKKEDE